MDPSYRTKGFAPIRFETDIDGLPIEGDWPEDLHGTLYRIGPNPQFEPIEPYNPLLGDGMVHALHCAGRAVRYRNRWVRTQQWLAEHAAGRALFASSGNPLHNDPSIGPARTDGVANTHLVWHGGRLLALEEGHPPIELDPLTLETRGQWNFDGALPSNMCAHPKVDPATGELIFFANFPRGRFDGELTWYVVNAAGHLTASHRLRAPFPALVHDFAVTGDFVVFVLCPATISLHRAAAGAPAIAWQPELGTHLAVFRRSDPQQVRWFATDTCFVWHLLNGWNEGSHIGLDLCTQAAPAFPDVDGSTNRAPETLRQRLARWELDWQRQDQVTTQTVSSEDCEYPRMDERFAMSRTGHGYLACRGGPGTGDPFHRGIAHFDFGRSELTRYDFGPECAVSEPVFVPRTGSRGEGDGFLLCLVYDERVDTSALALLDARRVADGPIAVAHTHHRVPMGFHGCWVAIDSD